MCGIAGFFETVKRTSAAEGRKNAKMMATAIAHRGPDDEGLWSDASHNLTLIHRRLSIIDLSPEGHQPMDSASGRYVIVFNGEIYNFPELRQTLEGQGCSFRGRSDTEIMLAAFDQWGVNAAIQKLNGMFAFALYDRQDNVLHFVRDRFGKKPLYIGWGGKTLLFGSELKALRAHPDFNNAIDRQALTLYTRYGCVPAPYSIYEGISQLLPGARLTLKLDSLSAGQDLKSLMEPYWHLSRVIEENRHKITPRSDEDAIDEFETLLGTCVQDRMISDVPLGAFLSGGIDSSAVVALMQRQTASPVKSFSIGFEEADFNEADHARAIAEHLGTDHHELTVTAAEARAVIPQIPTLYDEPFADVSQIPTYLVARFASQSVTVALSGDGGDEMLGGYNRHIVVPPLWNKIKWAPRPLRRVASHAIKSHTIEEWNATFPARPQCGEKLYKLAEILPSRESQDAYHRLTSQWPDPAALVIGGHEPLIPLTDPVWRVRGLSFAEQMMAGDALSYLPNDILVKLDRATMAVGLEARAPLLDRRIFDYAWSLPHEMKIRGQTGKWLLREVLARHVPRALFERPKQGFAVPIGEWLRGPLKDWAADLLDETKLAQQGYFNPAPIRAAWTAHQKGEGAHAHQLWTILMAQSWLEEQK